MFKKMGKIFLTGPDQEVRAGGDDRANAARGMRLEGLGDEALSGMAGERPGDHSVIV